LCNANKNLDTLDRSAIYDIETIRESLRESQLHEIPATKPCAFCGWDTKIFTRGKFPRYSEKIKK